MTHGDLFSNRSPGILLRFTVSSVQAFYTIWNVSRLTFRRGFRPGPSLVFPISGLPLVHLVRYSHRNGSFHWIFCSVWAFKSHIMVQHVVGWLWLLHSLQQWDILDIIRCLQLSEGSSVTSSLTSYSCTIFKMQLKRTFRCSLTLSVFTVNYWCSFEQQQVGIPSIIVNIHIQKNTSCVYYHPPHGAGTFLRGFVKVEPVWPFLQRTRMYNSKRK